MGCNSSKDTVKQITIKDGVVKPASGKTRKIKVHGSETFQVNDDNAIHISSEKSTSAKSRDSGIGELESSYLPDGIITENSDPNLISEIEKELRPGTPNLSLTGHMLNGANRERMKSKVILEELESQGLIRGTKVEKGGAAFEVSATQFHRLEPLEPIKLPPNLKTRQKSTLTKEELLEKQKLADERRQKSLTQPKKRSRLASQLARHQEIASNMQPLPDDDIFYDESKYSNPFQAQNEISRNE